MELKKVDLEDYSLKLSAVGSEKPRFSGPFEGENGPGGLGFDVVEGVENLGRASSGPWSLVGTYKSEPQRLELLWFGPGPFAERKRPVGRVSASSEGFLTNCPWREARYVGVRRVSSLSFGVLRQCLIHGAVQERKRGCCQAREVYG